MAERIESTGRGNLGVIGFDTAHLARDTARLSYLRQDQFSLIGPCHILIVFFTYRQNRNLEGFPDLKIHWTTLSEDSQVAGHLLKIDYNSLKPQ